MTLWTNRFRSRDCLLAALLLGATLAAYFPALRARYIWDDPVYVTENTNLQDLAGLRRIWLDPQASPQYYPLVYTTFWVEHHLWGMDPRGYHAVNVLLHAANALLLGLLLHRLGLKGAWGGAFLFALHPVEVESVAWVTERKNTLSFFFAAIAILAWLRFAGLDGRAPSKETRSRAYALTLGAFFLALLSKTVTSMVPVALVPILWWKRGRVVARDLVPLLPLVLWGGVFGLTTSVLEKHHVGAIGEDWGLGLFERLLVAGRTFWFYPLKLVWPDPLLFIYPRFEIDTTSFVGYLPVLGAITLFLVLAGTRERFGKGPLVACLVYAILYFPASGFFRVYMMRFTFVADHFFYHASAPLLGLAAAAISRLLAWPAVARIRTVVWAGMAVVLGALTCMQARIYQDEETLWTDTLARNPEAWIAGTNLGVVRQTQLRFADAIPLFLRAIEVRPDEATIHNNLGISYAKLGRHEEAIAAYREAVRIAPGYGTAWVNWGNSLLEEGRIDDAIAIFRTAAEAEPTLAMAYNRWGTALVASGHAEEARRLFEHAIVTDPAFPEPRYNLAVLLAEAGEKAAAIVEYERVLALDRGHGLAHNNLGVLRGEAGQSAEAIGHFEAALRSKPTLTDPRRNLAKLLAASGRTDEAIRQLRAAVRLTPDATLAHLDLGRLLIDEGRLDEATAALQKARELEPRSLEILDALSIALARAGRRDEALTEARRALALVRANGTPALASALEQRILEIESLPVTGVPGSRAPSP